MTMNGSLTAGGNLSLRVTRQKPKSSPPSAFWWQVRQRLFYRWREIPLCLFLLLYWTILRWAVPGLNVATGIVRLRWTGEDGTVVDLGIAGRHLVVTAGKNFIAGCFDGTNTITNLKYHGFGTGSTAAAAGDTALQTELTTQYAVSSTRPTGSQAHATNTYTTVGTIIPSAAVSLTEWGLLTQAATGGGTLLDHQIYTAVGLNGTGDSLAATYVLTQN
jgi:hypothetical protein